MQFDVFSLFPEVFEPYLQTSILQRASQRGLLVVRLHNIRDWTTDRHHVTDDEPYGGGGGMVMKPEPIFAAVEGVLGSPPACPVILLTPQGRSFTQAFARELAFGKRPAAEAGARRVGLLCGRYEGVDERVRQYLVSDEISIGDYVLTGGELAALVVIDAVTRLLPGALGDPDGADDDSHASGLLEYPHYTRPAEFRGWSVPEILISGDHARIARWRREQALQRTWQRRPDLLQSALESELISAQDRKFLMQLYQSADKDRPEGQTPSDDHPSAS
ncbi:MAG: tRNA (guanosine(37)-N1)-methyltransferase TrmD [Anaerolineales bacterium]|nr:tRNA (guanosine(37)-N1)-methyltransferase TrmD [Anaerolineales bacterium]